MQAAINAAYNYLPADLPNPPAYSKVNPADAPIMTLALTSSTMQLSKVEDIADTMLAQKISQLSGVGLVSINGGQKPAVRIRSNPTALAGVVNAQYAEQTRYKMGPQTTAAILQQQRNLAVAEDALISSTGAYTKDRAALQVLLSRHAGSFRHRHYNSGHRRPGTRHSKSHCASDAPHRRNRSSALLLQRLPQCGQKTIDA